MTYSCSGVAVSRGANLQGLIDSNPEGTTFCYATGTYRLTTALSLKSNDVLIGAQGATLNGSKVVTNWVLSGNYWYATGQTQQSALNGRCGDTYTGCQYNEDVYFDNRNLWQVTSLSSLVPGTFFFDYAKDTIYIADNPSGHLVEATIAPKAISTCAKYCPTSGEQVKGFLIEKFSTPTQDTVAGAAENGLFEGNEVRFIHGAAVDARSGGRVIHNYVHDIGQLCLSATGSTGALFKDNEVARCNTEGFAWGWEAGGAKFVDTTSLTVDGNYVHDIGFNAINSGGRALWSDIDNIYTVYSNNYISNVASDGILLEISYDTEVFGNTVIGAGKNLVPWGAGILIMNTKNVEAYSNFLDSNTRGVILVMEDRGSGEYGLYEVNNVYIHDNVIKLPSNTTGFNKSNDNSYFTLTHAHFESNTYYLPSLGAPVFGWTGTVLTKDQWMADGQDKLAHYYQL